MSTALKRNRSGGRNGQARAGFVDRVATSMRNACADFGYIPKVIGTMRMTGRSFISAAPPPTKGQWKTARGCWRMGVQKRCPAVFFFLSATIVWSKTKLKKKEARKCTGLVLCKMLSSIFTRPAVVILLKTCRSLANYNWVMVLLYSAPAGVKWGNSRESIGRGFSSFNVSPI